MAIFRAITLYLSISNILLPQHGSDDGWKQSTNLVSGVNWAKSKTAVTLGIWMWNRPFILTGWTGDKVKR